MIGPLPSGFLTKFQLSASRLPVCQLDSASLPVDSASLPVNSARLPVDTASLSHDSASLPVDSASLPVDTASLPVDIASWTGRIQLADWQPTGRLAPN